MRFRDRAQRAIGSRRVFRYLAGATLVLAVGAGVLVWLIDRRDFPTLGDALWWSIVTLATVGYGDVVPRTGWGRVVGSVVIVIGVTFLSVLTATITSYFVSADQADRAAEAEDSEAGGDEATQALLRDIAARLESIEARLGERVDEPS